MTKILMTILMVAAVILGLGFWAGCESDAQTGAAIGSLAGAGIGQLAGGLKIILLSNPCVRWIENISLRLVESYPQWKRV